MICRDLRGEAHRWRITKSAVTVASVAGLALGLLTGPAGAGASATVPEGGTAADSGPVADHSTAADSGTAAAEGTGPTAISAPDEPGFLVQVVDDAEVATVLAETVEPDADDVLDLSGEAFTGAAVDLSSGEAHRLKRDPRVLSVEPNGLIRVAAVGGWGMAPPTAVASNRAATSAWNLDRIDQRALPLDSRFAPVGSGAGTHVYIVDTGVDLDHPAFTGRIGTSMVATSIGSTPDDCNGHGTHVAGTASSRRFGVAARSTIHPVRVADCRGRGTKAGLIEGLNWIASDAAPRSVVNISLIGERSAAVDAAVGRLVDRGIPVVVAAGNEGLNACRLSPGRADSAITVGATKSSDRFAGFSGHGRCVDILAPGARIRSVRLGSADGSRTLSGTSMSAPLVTGTLAVLWSRAPERTGRRIRGLLLRLATRGRVRIPSTKSATPNRLLYLPRAGVPAPGTVVVRGTFGSNNSRRASFKFRADQPATSFECRLDSASWSRCRSPVSYRGLPNGRHRFRVRARDWLGRVDPSPAVKRFTVARRASVRLSTRRRASRLRVNVNPDLRSGNYRIEVQKRRAGRWRVVRRTWTKGREEVRTINLGAGRYRVRVPGQRGLLGSRSSVVTLRR